MWKARKTYLALCNHALVLQSFARMIKAKKISRRLRLAVVVQSAFRGMVSRREYARLLNSFPERKTIEIKNVELKKSPTESEVWKKIFLSTIIVKPINITKTWKPITQKPSTNSTVLVGANRLSAFQNEVEVENAIEVESISISPKSRRTVQISEAVK
jgi:hypothetical protein